MVGFPEELIPGSMVQVQSEAAGIIIGEFSFEADPESVIVGSCKVDRVGREIYSAIVP